MGLNVKIEDNGNGTVAEVESKKDTGNGLKVYTYEGKPVQSQNAFFTNDTYGSDLNQDGSAGGTPDQVHNGIDSVLWTASAISGTWTFNSTAQAHTGSNSIDATSTVNGETAQIAKGSNLTIANYVSLTGWIYISAWSTSGTKDVQIVAWDTGTASAVSSTINLSSYINTTSFGTWQQFSIPFAAFGFTSATLDAIRITTVDIGAGPPPDYYLDDIQFEQTGGGITYTIGPDKGEKWYITHINHVLVDAYAGTVTNGTMPNIPYDGFLGVNTLPSGIVIRRIQFEEATFSSTNTDFIDYINTPLPKHMISGSDGTNTWVRLESEFPTPVLFDGDKGDRFEIIINDDLTGLLYYKSSIVYSDAI